MRSESEAKPTMVKSSMTRQHNALSASDSGTERGNDIAEPKLETDSRAVFG